MKRRNRLKEVVNNDVKAQDDFVNHGDKRESLAEKEETKRLIVDLPAKMHHKLKGTAFMEGLTIKQYIMILIEDSFED